MTTTRLQFLCPDRGLAGAGRCVVAASILLMVSGLSSASPGPSSSGLDWSLSARTIAAGPVRASSIEAHSEADGRTVIQVMDVDLPTLGSWGELRMTCAPGTIRCAKGTMQRRPSSADDPTRSESTATEVIEFERTPNGARLSGAGGQAELTLAPALALRVESWPLVPWLGQTDLPIDLQGGRLDASAATEAGRIRFESALEALSFDTADGRFAGAELAFTMRGALAERGLEGTLSWTGGEALLDAVYLPSPDSELEIDYEVRFEGSESRVRLTFGADDWLDASLHARLEPAMGLSLDALAEARLRVESLDLARAWPMGPESLAARAGWPELDVRGQVSGGVDWRADRAPRIELDWRAVDVEDPAGRIRVRGLEGRFDIDAETERLEARFDAATLYRLPLDASRWVLAGRDGQIALQEPLRIPLLDGAIRIDRLTIERGDPGPPSIDLDAAIEPLDLARLTGTLGLPRFGGSVSGRIPAVRLDGETLRVGGGLDLELFSGQARITGLSIERPFGTLPALSASLEFQRLDLAPLTSAFEFGAMQGELSGYVNGLRLLDWQPVAFDAWLATERDTRKPRRISQRAVDQIARLGGGGAAALSAPILRLFDDFGYTQIGLGCRLAANVCTMRGVRELEGGGYMIVDGRGIPRLNVVGFRREVDWPVLLAQLKAATQGDGIRVGDSPAADR